MADDKNIKSNSSEPNKGQIRAQKGKGKVSKNVGKKFEKAVEDSFRSETDISIDRVHDQTTKYKNSTNICDYIVYRYPHQYYIECKSVHGNTLSIHSVPKLGKDGKLHGFHGNISDAQWDGLLEKSKILGVYAGVICWWVDKDITLYLSIQELQKLYDSGVKSVKYDIIDEEPYNSTNYGIIWAMGRKKRTYFDYSTQLLLDEINKYQTEWKSTRDWMLLNF